MLLHIVQAGWGKITLDTEFQARRLALKPSAEEAAREFHRIVGGSFKEVADGIVKGTTIAWIEVDGGAKLRLTPDNT